MRKPSFPFFLLLVFIFFYFYNITSFRRYFLISKLKFFVNIFIKKLKVDKTLGDSLGKDFLQIFKRITHSDKKFY